ncbi:WYL domain-containing protein [Ruminococcus albus]|uniref:WYL domain-containing protein n=1 Tax=Ruminococcus albus TaxID=1264 RepID=A0A1I1QH38_RUMAL|nr:WYL domain-containing protein [Ruminococcus albus]SFD21396.1 WYL domain-containing protein [Ruminococcus albus]
MAGFSELIKNFGKTRDYIRDFFIYGCKVRSDFNRKSLRTYSDEKRRVESWMGDYMRYDESVRGRSVSISVDSCHIPENPLYNAFYSKSFTDNDMVLHFLLTDILSDGHYRALKDIVDELNNEYSMLFDEQTVRNKLKEYTQEGLILTEKRGKTLYYSLCGDRTDEYINRFEGLDDALKYFSETQHFGVIGNSILKSVGMNNDLFFIKHNYIIHTLEDILIPDILSAIDEKRYITLRTFSANKSSDSDDSGREAQAVPMQILISVQTGRRYLAAYIPAVKRFSAFRLDYIKTVKKSTVCEKYNELKDKYEKNISRCFGVSFGKRKDMGTVAPMKITFYADEEKEPHIIERLHREKRCCILEKSGEHLYTLTADVFDPNEMMQWVKTFIGRIVKIEGGTSEIIQRFYKDIIRMEKMYGGDDDEHIQ